MTRDTELLRRLKISKTMKGKIPWNKGKTVKTDIRIKKLRYWLGKKASDETKKKMSIFQTGRKMSAESKEKMRISKIGILNPTYGKKQSFELIEKRIAKSRGRHNYWLVGDKNKNWKGGISKDKQSLRRSGDFANWRRKIFKRDNYTCLNCGRGDGKIHPHHVKEFAYYLESRFDLDNGVTLCVKCHKTIHAYYAVNKLNGVN